MLFLTGFAFPLLHWVAFWLLRFCAGLLGGVRVVSDSLRFRFCTGLLFGDFASALGCSAGALVASALGGLVVASDSPLRVTQCLLVWWLQFCSVVGSSLWWL